jgi:glycosyltransferase involved in cell wall biosynthesis
MTAVTIAGPDEDESGIGGYIEDLTGEMSECRIERETLPMECNNPVTFARRAVRIGLTDADVIHLQHEYGIFGTASLMSWVFFPILYVLAALRGVPVVLTIHEGLNEGLATEPLKRFKQVYLAALNRIILLYVTHVVFLSKNSADEFTESVPLTSYTVLPHGAHTGRSVDVDEETAKHSLECDSDRAVLTEPGYVEPRKGSHLLVDLADRLSEHQFLLAGGPAKQSYEGYVRQIEDSAPCNLTVTGFLEDEAFHSAFVASDLILLPYQNVDQSGVVNTVNQSGIFNYCAGYGKPVIASDTAYFRSLERQWGCLRTCDFEDLENVEATVRELLNDAEARERLAERIRAYAEANSFAEVAKRHERIYRTISTRDTQTSLKSIGGERTDG